MSHLMSKRGWVFVTNAKATFVMVLVVLSLLFSGVVVKGDWKSDANARIEANRKRDAQITVWDTDNNPVPDVTVTIEQVKHRFGFGTCLAYGLLTGTDYQDFVLDHFEWAVCENEMKWSSNESTNNQWTFSNADYIANWCADNDIVLRGHNLVWETGGQTPSWVSGLQCATYPTTSQMMDEIDDRINTTVGRYAGQIVSWDVDNEMLSGNMFDCLGEAGRAHFFEQGNSVDPDCGFYMNEYAGNSFGGYDGWTYANRASGLISLGAPVEGLGIQAHVASPFRPQDYYDDVLEPLATLGLPIIATEFDTDAGTETQAADDLENLYRICFSHSNVEAVIMWGFTESAWRGNGIVNSSTWVLNEAGERYESLLDEWTTSDSGITNPSGNMTFRGFHGTYQITVSAPGETTEVHTIELEPGTGTQTFIIETNFTPSTPDTTPPDPDPMTWASAPSATGPTSITMTATTATDDNPPVEYYFECTNYSAASSTWQTNTTYVATGLSPSTEYTFKVKARDNAAAQNETGFSGTASATTDPPDLTPPEPNPMTWASAPALSGSNAITMTASTAVDDDSPPVEYYFECTTDGDFNSPWQSSPTYEATDLDYLTTYNFRVKARDSSPAQNVTGWSSTLSATTEPPSTDVEILGSWTTGTSHTKEAGTSRALLFIAHAEHGSAVTLNSVTYGGQDMNNITSEIVGTGYRAYVTAYILDEAGIDAATSNTFTPSWSTTPDNFGYASVFLENVDQTDPIGEFDESSVANDTRTITTSSLSTEDGDTVIVAATCGNAGDYTVNSGFSEALEHDMASSTGTDGYKFAAGAPETPSVTFGSTVNRQVIIGFVIQAAEPNEFQNCSEVHAGGYGLASDLNADCYVDYWDFDTIGYYWLATDCAGFDNCEGADFEPMDGTVDLFDFSDFAAQWMWCNDPQDPSCTPNW